MIGCSGAADLRCANHQRELVREVDGDTDRDIVRGMAHV